MVLIEIVVAPRHTIAPLALIAIYLCDVALTCANTASFFQGNESLPSSLIKGHLTFSIIGCVVFVFFSCSVWLWSARYAWDLDNRVWLLFLGVWALCFLKDLPILIIEVVAMQQSKWWDSILQSITLIVQIIVLVVSGIASWLSQCWYMAGFLERVVCAKQHPNNLQAWKVVEPRPDPHLPPHLILRESRSPARYPGQLFNTPAQLAHSKASYVLTGRRMALGRSHPHAPPVI